MFVNICCSSVFLKYTFSSQKRTELNVYFILLPIISYLVAEK